MPWSLFFTTEPNVNELSTQTSIETHSNHELTPAKDKSLLTSLRRIYSYSLQIVWNKIRFVIALLYVTVLRIARRLLTLTGQRTSSAISTLDEDINPSSTSLIPSTHSQVDRPSLEESTMAHMLIHQQQQQPHRSANISIHPSRPIEDEVLLPMSHSVDEGLYYYKQNSRSLLHLLHKFASEPQMSTCRSTANCLLNIDPTKFTAADTFLPLNEPEEDEEEIIAPICDKTEPVITKETNKAQPDEISTELEDDALLPTNATTNGERSFRRRKRRPSLTRSSSFNEEPEPILTIDSTTNTDDNNNPLPEVKDDDSSQTIPQENLSSNEKVEEEEEATTTEKRMPSRRFGGRRLKRRPSSYLSSPIEEPTTDNTVQFFVPTETLPSPTVEAAFPVLSAVNLNVLNGALKRTGSAGTTKKMVRFADSVGRELTQVQYIQSSPDDDRSLVKNHHYRTESEFKPWSFDIASTSKPVSTSRLPKRFFCLYRQPNSEHPDIYLHEVWKSQIKLEHADIRLKSSSTGQQCLHGTLWVTNASFWKQVTVKYSFNRWLNTNDYEAQHRCHSSDFRNIDQFEFSIDLPQDVDRIDFVLRYSVNGQEHWDNNEGKNYTLETESAYTPHTTISLPHDCDINDMRFY